MKPTAAFVRLWLATDTHIYNMTPAQFKRVRQLCESFYEAGKKHNEEKISVQAACCP